MAIVGLNFLTILYTTYSTSLNLDYLLEKYAEDIPVQFERFIRGFNSPVYASQHLIGKLLLATSLKENGYEDSINLIWNCPKGKHGKRYLPNGPFFNISHTDGLVVVVLSSLAPIGVDAEKIRDVDPFRYKNRLFHESEWIALQKRRNVPSKFWEFWTQKEATMKADGRGFSMGAKNILLSNEKSVLLDSNEMCFLKVINTIPGYCISIACSSSLNNVDIKHVNLEFLHL